MKFGVFDHMDRAGPSLAAQYEDRLKLAEAYDAAGFHMYHLAEHHATPLGMAPSPSVFLAAVGQRTRRLRFGPLVYPLAMYHPLRVVEEICMLDHLSGGRFEFGVGKGASPHELAIYGLDKTDVANAAYEEALQIVMLALTSDRLTFQGKHFSFTDVPLELRPLQRPHPPMWYGVGRLEAAVRSARRGLSIVVNHPAERARELLSAYRAEWEASGRPASELPLTGINRFVVISENEDEAIAAAARAYRQWNHSFWKLWDDRGPRPYTYYPNTFEEALSQGWGVAGTPQQVLDTLASQVEAVGCNYLVCRTLFGNLTVAEARRSVELFAEHVMPGLAALSPRVS
ncbi:MAG TPA: LLM class flavin-dependent oxidoreductase [Stellaceae bacterium]|nr:LLM class flavin-dependent oxidoreductase [Stellaceae bacterium]